MFGRIDGDGLEGGEGVHTGLDGEPCAEGEVLFRDDGVVGDDADLEAGLGEDAGGLEGLVDQLDLAGVGEGGAHGHGDVGADQFVNDEVALGAVFDGDLDAELLGDAQGGADIVGAVGVGLEGHLALEDGDEGLHLHVKFGALEGVVPGGLFAL